VNPRNGRRTRIRRNAIFAVVALVVIAALALFVRQAWNASPSYATTIVNQQPANQPPAVQQPAGNDTSAGGAKGGGAGTK
jgi:predicted Abi (CAAX) family protease